MPQVAAISQQIWDMKYRLKGSDGAPVDRTIEDSWRRVAEALAEAEPEAHRAEMTDRFAAAMADFKFLPAGRILAGAGAKRSVTLFNCFVMGTVPDDMSGIFEHLREAALTMQQGGGIGYDFSTLRPKGAPVKGVGADASGPLSFMDVWDAMCRTIMSAGHRRGAMMATLRCDHPDIEAFIDAKREAGRLRMFNLSVLATDDFMQAIKEDRPWELKFGGTTYRVVQARELWDRIMRSTYATAEPGVIFIDRINKRNNLYYCESIQATNPCVTGDTWVQTTEGPRQVSDLVGKRFRAMVDGESFASDAEGFFSTGTKPVLHLKTRAGFELRLTADHPVSRANGFSLRGGLREWVKAGDLKVGERVVLNNHQSLSGWVGCHGFTEGYAIGNFATGNREEAWDVLRRSGVQQVANSGGTPSFYSSDENELFAFVQSMGVAGDEIRLSSAVERTSYDFHRGFLSALFENNGFVHRRDGYVRLRPFYGDVADLKLVQRMLLRLGIISKIQPGGFTIGGGENLARFAKIIGFFDEGKQAQLKAVLEKQGDLLLPEWFVSEVASIEPDGEAEVFDVKIDKIHAFDANGLLVHNCGEQPLPPYGACLLGSINLAMLVQRPFEEDAGLDMPALDALVATAIRMLDDAIDVSNFPLPQQLHEAKAKRRIGLGVTGLADALIMCGARYGSSAAVRLTERWMKAIERAAYLASAALAAEKGPFPLYDREQFLAGETVRGLDEDVRAAIAQHGIRNGLLTSIAPTGTISLFADNVSSGLEPVFSFKYTRNILMPDGSRQAEEVSDHAYRLFRRLKGEETPLPDAFVDAQSLTPSDHVIMQAAVQKYVDSAISKTINVPVELPFEDFKDIYSLAYESGCKGCTTYRPNEITGAVLETKPKTALVPAQTELPLPRRVEHKPEDVYEAGGVVYMTQPLDRPEALPGSTYKIRWPESDHAIYVTINDIIQDGRRRPFEVFINSKNMEHYAWTVGLTRMISAVFRRGGDVSFVADELKAVFDPRGGSWMDGRYVPSLLAAIGGVIERHMIQIGFLPDPAKDRAEFEHMAARKVANLADGQGNGDAGGRKLAHCPKCGSPSLIRQEGCDLCTSCGYSKCG